MAKNIVIGVGNLLFLDDGIGVFVAKYLQKNFSFKPDIEILDGGTLGFNLIEYFINYDNVIIVDTISLNEKAGDIFRIPSDELLGHGSYKKTAHEVEVVQMLEACELYDKKANIVVLGIVPENISRVEIGLSDTLKEKFYRFVDAIIDEIKSLDVELTKENNFTFEEIAKELRC